MCQKTCKILCPFRAGKTARKATCSLTQWARQKHHSLSWMAFSVLYSLPPMFPAKSRQKDFSFLFVIRRRNHRQASGIFSGVRDVFLATWDLLKNFHFHSQKNIFSWAWARMTIRIKIAHDSDSVVLINFLFNSILTKIHVGSPFWTWDWVAIFTAAHSPLWHVSLSKKPQRARTRASQSVFSHLVFHLSGQGHRGHFPSGDIQLCNLPFFDSPCPMIFPNQNKKDSEHCDTFHCKKCIPSRPTPAEPCRKRSKSFPAGQD